MSTCLNITRAGKPCGRRCFDSACYKHKGKRSHTICSTPGCGRGTMSVTGVCAACPNHKQIQAHNTRNRQAAAAAAAAAREAARAEVIFDQILAELRAAEGIISERPKISA